MNSLSDLNSLGSSTIEITDDRPAGIRYSPPMPSAPFDQILNVTTTAVSVGAGIDITEIINYSLANVRYQVKINPGINNPLTGSSISWASLPTGVTLSVIDQTYTLSGINTVAQWQAIKNFTWNLPANYATKPLWFLEISVLYYDQQSLTEKSVDWIAYDEDFYYFTELTSSSNLSCDALDVILFEANLSGAFSPTLSMIRLKGFNVSMSSQLNLTVTGQINSTNLSSSTSATAKITYQTSGRANFNLTSTVSCNGIIAVSNMLPRSYIANNENILFATDIPQIEEYPVSGQNYTIIFSSSLGTFSNSDTVFPTSPFSYTGTLSQVNNVFNQIRFYPTKGTSSNGTFSYTQQKNSVTQLTRTINLTGQAGSYIAKSYNFYSSAIWTPKNDDLIYNSSIDVLLVGAGGGGGYSGGGGGGGVKDVVGATLSSQSYNILIGSGGTPAPSHPSIANGGTPGKGGNGGTTSAFGYSATGGTGGYDEGYPTYDGQGGPSGIPAYDATTAYAGGASLGTNVANIVGGGGGGSDGIGLPYWKPNGGAGKPSVIDGVYYGGGGIGGNNSFGYYLRGGNAGVTRTAKLLTNYGSVSINTTTKKYGSGSCYFDGSSYLRSTTSYSDFGFINPTYSIIEMWVYRTRTNQKEMLVDFGTSAGGGPTIYFDSFGGNKLTYRDEYGFEYSYAIGNWTNQWHHIAVVFDRVSPQRYLYVDGVIVQQTGLSTNVRGPTSKTMTIGADYANNFKFQGYIDDLRITLNQVYSFSGFLTPTRELKNLTETVFLLNANTIIEDAANNLQDSAGGGDVTTLWNGVDNRGGGGGGGIQSNNSGSGAGYGGSGYIFVRFNS